MTINYSKEKLVYLYENMVQNYPDHALVLLDIEGTILSWNDSVQEMKGYTADEILGQNFEIFYTLKDREAKLPHQLIALAKKEGSARHIGKRVTKDGTAFWGSISITALKDEHNRILGFAKSTRKWLVAIWAIDYIPNPYLPFSLNFIVRFIKIARDSRIIGICRRRQIDVNNGIMIL